MKYSMVLNANVNILNAHVEIRTHILNASGKTRTLVRWTSDLWAGQKHHVELQACEPYFSHTQAICGISYGLP